MKDRSTLALTASFAASIGASLCCTVPLILVLAGLGGSWLSTLRAFDPIRPLFIIGAAGALAFAYPPIFRKPAACSPDQQCAESGVQRRRKLLFWVVGILVAGILASPYLIAYLE